MYDLVDLFLKQTQKTALGNITHIDNIPSIMQHGILCHELTQKVKHQSIALEPVQDRRHNKRVPNGLPLHQYACLYFSPRNPMMYYRKCNDQIIKMEDLCVLMVSPLVLAENGVVISDGNATSAITRFYDVEEGLQSLNFDMVYAEWWHSDDVFEKEEKKRVKCAEVLVPRGVPYHFITGAVVPTESTKGELLDRGFDRQIIISPYTFFFEGGE